MIAPCILHHLGAASCADRRSCLGPLTPPRSPSSSPSSPSTPRRPEPFRAPADRPVDVKHIRLDLKVDLPNKTVDGVATLTLEALRPLKSLSLDAVEFEVKKVSLANDDNGGTPIPFSHDGKHLDLDLDRLGRPTAMPSSASNTASATRGPGCTSSQPSAAEPDVPLSVWSQGEPTDNRYWFPCLDNPNQQQTTELVVTAADGYEVLSNGKLAEKKANGDGTVTWHWTQPQPHASYLVTLVVGKFDVVRDEWRGKEVSYYVPVGHKDDIGRSFGRTREMLDFFSRRFGIDYPWEKYAQVVVEQFTAGGMENTTATTLNDYALLDERALLDGDVDGLVSHELAHQWWGDLVTCRDWAHIWLNEGFASYAKSSGRSTATGPTGRPWTCRASCTRRDRRRQGSRPIVDRRYPNPDSMFDARAYPKGAWVLHMLRKQLGDDVFWQGHPHLRQREPLQERRDQRFPQGDGAGQRPGPGAVLLRLDRTARAPGAEGRRRSTCRTRSRSASRSSRRSRARRSTFRCRSDPDCRFRRPRAGRRCGPEMSLPNGRYANARPRSRRRSRCSSSTSPSRPGLIVIDPDLTVFCEMTEEKGRRPVVQINSATGPTAVGPDDGGGPPRQEQAGRGPGSAGGGAQGGEVLGRAGPHRRRRSARSGGDMCRAALIEGMKQPDARVRRACVKALGTYRKERHGHGGAQGQAQRGRSERRSRGGVARGPMPTLSRPDVVAVLTAVPGEAVAAGGDSGGGHQRAGGEPGLVGAGHAHRLDAAGKPLRVRTTAMEGLAELAKTGNPTDEQRQADRRRRWPPVSTTRAGGCGRRPSEHAAGIGPVGRGVAAGPGGDRPPRPGRPGAGGGDQGGRGDPVQQPGPGRADPAAGGAGPAQKGERRPARTARPFRAEVGEGLTTKAQRAQRRK